MMLCVALLIGIVVLAAALSTSVLIAADTYIVAVLYFWVVLAPLPWSILGRSFGGWSAAWGGKYFGHKDATALRRAGYIRWIASTVVVLGLALCLLSALVAGRPAQASHIFVFLVAWQSGFTWSYLRLVRTP